MRRPRPPLRVKGPAALLVACILLSGCLSLVTCPGCEHEWYRRVTDPAAQGRVPELYNALPAANVSGNNYAEEDRRGVTVQHPVLDAAWREYRLMHATWRPSADEPLVGAFARPDPARPLLDVRVEVPVGAGLERARETFRAFVPRVVPDADPAQVEAWSQDLRLLAEGSDARLEDPARSTRTPSTQYVATLRAPHRLHDLLNETVGADPRPEPGPTYPLEQGVVRAEEWTFTFGFPTRRVHHVADGVSLFLEANPWGGYELDFDTEQPVRSATARDLFLRAMTETLRLPRDLAERFPVPE